MQNNFRDQIVEHMFQIFSDNPENSYAIPLLLEQVGMAFSMDRIYICENSDLNQFLCTFQWAKENISSLFDSLKTIPTPPPKKILNI